MTTKDLLIQLSSMGSLSDLSLMEIEVIIRKTGGSLNDVVFIRDYKKAAELAKSMNFGTPEEYHKLWNPLTGLPYFPEIFYSGGRGWKTDCNENDAWLDYLGSYQPQENIYSFYEAIDVLRKLEIRLPREYGKKAKHDPKLPWDPEKHYGKRFKWFEFLGYYSPEKILVVIRENNIFYELDYRKLSKIECRLPPHPVVYNIPEWQNLINMINAAWTKK